MYDENKKEKPSLKEVEPSIFMDSDSRVKKLFICRAVLWAVALAATVYWIWWSFEIYNRGVFDPYEYAPMLRPVLTFACCKGTKCFSIFKIFNISVSERSSIDFVG